MSQDSEGYRQICALLNLAWNNCARDIFQVIYMIVGGCLFSGVYLVVASLQILEGFSKLPRDTEFGPAGEIIYQAMYGAIPKVAAILLLIAILVILFEYTLSFTTICYYYDNKSWAVPRLIRDAVKRLADHFRSEREENRQADRKYRIFLENEINKIHNGFVEEPKKE